jgi:hypothetical protein
VTPSSGDAVQYIHAPGYRLFSPLQVVLATLLGTPLAGSLALAWNYALLERTARAVSAVTLGFWGTVGVCAAFALSADPGVRMAAVIVPIGIVVVVAQLLQARLYRDHEQHGGQTIPYWHAAALGGACSALLVGGYYVLLHTALGDQAFAGIGLLRPIPKITFGPNEEIYYEKGATEADARLMGRFLQRLEIFNGQAAMTLRISRRGQTVVVGITVREGTWDKPVRPWAMLREELARDVFPGQPVEVQLLDEHQNVRKTIE